MKSICLTARVLSHKATRQDELPSKTACNGGYSGAGGGKNFSPLHEV